MNKARKQYIESCEVSEVVTVDLGGFAQKIAIEGKKRDLPVVICLHGGPGSPVPFSVGVRGLFPEWTDRAVMVYWDQLGCGINNRKIDDSFTIDSFVQMTCDLVGEIKNRFPQNKIYLFGVSWGSILALKTVLRIPEMLNGALIYGQFLESNFFSEEVEAAFSSAPEKVKNQVSAIVKTGADCKYKILNKNLKKLFHYLNQYTNAYENKNAEPTPVGEIVKGLLFSPDYRFRDFMAIVKNGYQKNKSLWGELVKIHLAPCLSKVKIPYVMMQGDTDIVTSTALVVQAAQESGNEKVSVKTVKDSGHIPSKSAMEEVFYVLLEMIK